MDPVSPQVNNQAVVDLTGRQLGDYQLLRRLGRGGMAVVYLAKQVSLNRNVAVKILNPHLAKDESYVQRFRQEAQAAANLVQANIVQIYEVGENDGFYFIAQEYIHGRNLKQHLVRHGAVEPVMAINVLRQCTMALQKAGELRVIHRDIKPENIMLSTKGEVKITDFGLARINGESPDQALTQIGMTMGTPLYMSPEQVEGGDIDERSDIYSLGVTAYHMLAGVPPYDGENALAIALKHVKDKPRSLKQLRPDVPSELCDIINYMMEKHRSNRPENAKRVLKELRKIKVDMDDDWEMIVEKLTVSDANTLLDDSQVPSSLMATRQLQAIMKGNIRSWWKTPRVMLTLAGLAIAGLLGGWALASQTAPETLLNVDQIDNSEIPRKATASQQYEAAYWASYRYSDDGEKQELYWKAVLDYFPPEQAPPSEQNRTTLINRNAKARLGELYLDYDMPKKALEIYNEFTSYEELAETFRITGYAGQAIVFDGLASSEFEGGVEEKNAKIQSAIGEIGARQELLNPFMKSRLTKVKNRLDTLEQLEDFKEQFPDFIKESRSKSWPLDFFAANPSAITSFSLAQRRQYL